MLYQIHPTAAAGFADSNLANRLLGAGEVVVGYDNLSPLMLEVIASVRQHQTFAFAQAFWAVPKRLVLFETPPAGQLIPAGVRSVLAIDHLAAGTPPPRMAGRRQNEPPRPCLMRDQGETA
jgi:hypothetical protein